MRKLKMEEIEEFANRPNVKKVAVENFLMSMEEDLTITIGNISLNAKSYGWNKQTIQAILDGILLAAGLDKDVDKIKKEEMEKFPETENEKLTDEYFRCRIKELTDKYFRHRIKKLADEYFTIEEKILSEIKNLPNYNKGCDCEDMNRFCIVDDDVISCYCLNCGGEINYCINSW